MSGVAESLFATLFPSDCRLCGAPLINISRLPICQACLSDMRSIEGGVCFVCGERLLSPYAFAGTPDEPRCGLCRRLEPTFARAVAYGSYEGGLRELIHLLKYEQVHPAARVLGRMLAEAMNELGSSWAQQPVVVVPVPLHARKLRQRGFNQSELIVRHALKLWCGKRPAGASYRGSGAMSRDPIADWADAASAAGKHSRCVCRGPARANRRLRGSAGRRRVHHRHHSFGVRPGSATGGRI